MIEARLPAIDCRLTPRSAPARRRQLPREFDSRPAEIRVNLPAFVPMVLLDLARGDAVLQRLSHDVAMFLDRATRARERARQSPGRAERFFHERMEISWMKLAASAALVERVDLFLQTLEAKVLPHDSCPQCRGLMRITTIESARYRDVFAFECYGCGLVEERTLARASTILSQ